MQLVLPSWLKLLSNLDQTGPSGAMWPSVFVSITWAADGCEDPGESHLEVEECEISISQVQTWTLGTPRYWLGSLSGWSGLVGVFRMLDWIFFRVENLVASKEDEFFFSKKRPGTCVLFHLGRWSFQHFLWEEGNFESGNLFSLNLNPQCILIPTPGQSCCSDGPHGFRAIDLATGPVGGEMHAVLVRYPGKKVQLLPRNFLSW